MNIKKILHRKVLDLNEPLFYFPEFAVSDWRELAVAPLKLMSKSI